MTFPIQPGDIGNTALLIRDLFKYFTEADGYESWTVDRKLNALHTASVKAVVERDIDAVYRLLGEYRRLQNTII